MSITGSHALGLGLTGPLVFNILTAPADRIKLLLQVQDEIIHNLREESLNVHTHLHPNSHCNNNSKSNNDNVAVDSIHSNLPSDEVMDQMLSLNVSSPYQRINNKEDNGYIEQEGQGDEENNEPRSIIMPYAQLPYTSIQDCAERLVEKEGLRSLWRGCSAEGARLIIQTKIEACLQRNQFGFHRCLSHCNTTTYGGSAAWILGTAINGTIVSAVALLAVYPLAVLRTKMATDIVRRTKSIKEKPSQGCTAFLGADDTRIPSACNNNLELFSTAPSTSSTSTNSPLSTLDLEEIEWVEEGSQQAQEMLKGSTPDLNIVNSITSATTIASNQGREYVLSYKYSSLCEAIQVTISTEGFFGLYKGFSTALVNIFVSRVGFLTIYRTAMPALLQSKNSSHLGSLLLMLSVSSIIHLMVYPLSTVCHRRMIAAPGRFSSSWDAVKQIVKKHGWKALYKGCEAAIVRSAAISILASFFL
ncbi:hypothetical protein BX616_010955 [Lobosporangium transversale]|uniref:ADP/ATP translocase n=1 Tax=Lobosporangium transversale TaxID=64571 RepID=A0A1Y2GD21_9FUNG|nr:mitochondrial carrier domain-containing protein [Lobosporangium transversale]KAF9919220.1 hypothetical protein BX616_010955 [Lobosporangium transversale]ORZ05695.1 mitochondrial carrier domain-containing protein [Lobosporangium transversale]|eukprot:XP_021877182.1 mitochondrial carrier domain-containing protein [Lobosporangium transversale]